MEPTPKRAGRAEFTSHRPRFTPVHALTAVTMVAAGLLLGTSAASYGGGRQATDLRTLLRNEQESSAKKAHHVEQLRDEVKKLSVSQQTQPQTVTVPQIAAGTTPVSGPGISVSLSDAPNPPANAPNVDDYVVHQQDVEGAMNALWSGGAEAMTVQGHRITSDSKIRCVGNVIYVDGMVHSPPFVITAIGDPQQLQRALQKDPAMQIYRQYVEAKGLGYSVTKQQNVKMPAATVVGIKEEPSDRS